MKNALFAALLGAAAMLPLSSQAQHLHEGDIEVSVEGGRLTPHGNHAWHADGSAVFEGDFGDLAGGPYKTDDPGFDSETGSFAAGTIIGYNALYTLQFWNGSQWAAVVPGSEYVRLDGNLGEDTRWTTSGVIGDLSGVIGQAGADGKIHEHLDFSVARNGGGTPAVGAYLIGLQLTADGYDASVPFYMAFNRGLTADQFEFAVESLAPVPEPETYALMIAGLLAVGLRARVRRAD